MLLNPYFNFALTPEGEAHVHRRAITDPSVMRKLGQQAHRAAAALTMRRGTSDHWIDYRVTFGNERGHHDARVYFRKEVVPYTDECAYGRSLARERARAALGVSRHVPVSVRALAWSPSIDDLMH